MRRTRWHRRLRSPAARLSPWERTIEIRRASAPQTQVIDLRGRTAHRVDRYSRPFLRGGALYTIDLSDLTIRKMDDVLARVAEKVAKTEARRVGRGRGWDEGKLAERRYITAADLDPVAPNNPVWLDAHDRTLRRRQQRRAADGRESREDTPDPPAGTIDRDARGSPTGVLKESAKALVTRLVPPFTREQQKQGIVRMIEDFNKEGMTGVKDPGIDQAKWDLYQELLKEDKLNVRVFALWPARTARGARPGARPHRRRCRRPPASLGDGRLISGGVKLYMDGSGGARTAWMHEDWNKNSDEKDTGNAAIRRLRPTAYRQIVDRLHNAGIHVSTHAIGDRAIDWVVDTYELALRRSRPAACATASSTPTRRPITRSTSWRGCRGSYDAGYPGSAVHLPLVDRRQLRRQSRTGALRCD